jgi:Predicted DNA-binding proteins
MVRPHKERRIQQLPPITHYKPVAIPLRDLDEIVLTYEEMESVRLVDCEQFDMGEAAESMAVSRPTLHRIVSRARQKIATALWQGKALRIEGGTFRLEHANEDRMRHFLCDECGHKWTVPYGTGKRGHDMRCPNCQAHKVRRDE